MDANFKIKVSKCEEYEIKTHTFHSYDDARCWVDRQLVKFKNRNGVRDESKDRYFLAFKAEMERMLEEGVF